MQKPADLLWHTLVSKRFVSSFDGRRNLLGRCVVDGATLLRREFLGCLSGSELVDQPRRIS